MNEGREIFYGFAGEIQCEMEMKLPGNEAVVKENGVFKQKYRKKMHQIFLILRKKKEK